MDYAALLERMGLDAEARRAYNAAIEAVPKNPMPYLRMADFLDRQDEKQAARAMREKARQLAPQQKSRKMRPLPTEEELRRLREERRQKKP